LARRDVHDFSIVQIYRFRSPLPRDLEQRGKVVCGRAVSDREIGLYGRSSQMPVKDRFRCFEANAFVLAV
jgi:hypothetical protein